MFAYIVRRVLLMIPTLFGIMLVNFAIIQAAPGGPVEQMIAQIKGKSGRRRPRPGPPANIAARAASRRN
jgi:microcin C transport system permease protein